MWWPTFRFVPFSTPYVHPNLPPNGRSNWAGTIIRHWNSGQIVAHRAKLRIDRRCEVIAVANAPIYIQWIRIVFAGKKNLSSTSAASVPQFVGI